jgi:Protein of unknown function (DUF3619)
MSRRATSSFAADPAALQARFGARVAALLAERSAQVPHDIGERLRVARDQAVARARLARTSAATVSVVGMSSQGAAVLGGFVPWWQRALSVVPLAVLVAGLMLANRWVLQEQVLDSAEIDAVLLADDLPPAAYSDPGFGEYLRTAPP